MEIPERPEFLNDLFKKQSERKTYQQEIYNRFLKDAEDSIVDMNIKGMISVRLASKLWKPNPEEMQDKNSSLRIIYDFYAKFHPPPLTLTFDEKAEEDSSLDFFELLIFCRNFNVIPKLITREELKFLLKFKQIQRIRNGEGHQRTLDFNDFKRFLAEVALLAYHKPGMFALIESVCKCTPTSQMMIESFSKYLYLHDEIRVRHIIDTNGRQSIARYNFRSAGDVFQKKLTVHELREDSRAKRYQ